MNWPMKQDGSGGSWLQRLLDDDGMSVERGEFYRVTRSGAGRPAILASSLVVCIVAGLAYVNQPPRDEIATAGMLPIRARSSGDPRDVVEHVVQPGDTLYAIAEIYRVSDVRALGAFNHLADPNLIRVGDRIRVPNHLRTLGAQ